MAEGSVQPPEGLREELISMVADRFAVSSFHGPFVDIDATPVNVVDAVLAALFDACEVREQWGVRADVERVPDFWPEEATRQRAQWAIAARAGYSFQSYLIRRCDLLTPPESVVSYPENQEDGD
jgi:hypothetical protein